MNSINTSSDIHECNEGSDDCHDNATCTDTDGSYNCTCNLGYSGNGTHCEGWFSNKDLGRCSQDILILTISF